MDEVAEPADSQLEAASLVSAQETKQSAVWDYPENIRDKYDIIGYRHAETIFRYDFPEIFSQLIDMLAAFTFPYSHIIFGGGGKGKIAVEFDKQLTAVGFKEKKVEVAQIIDGHRIDSPSHKVDFYKDRVAVELEWNNKTEFYDRDLDNFRKLHALGVLSVGVIVTRAIRLDNFFPEVDALLAQMPFHYTRKNGKAEDVKSISDKYGASTTRDDKLYPKIDGGAGGQCPLLVFAMREVAAVNDYSEAMKRAKAAGRMFVIPEDLLASAQIGPNDIDSLLGDTDGPEQG